MKKLLANKNVVTILGAVLIVIVLYAFYNYRVNRAIEPIKVPYARVTIGPRTEITNDMIAYVDIQQSALVGDVLTNPNTQIVGKYTDINCTIPAGSMFFKETLKRREELADSFLIDIPKDENGVDMIAYNYRVNVLTTYGNSIYPGNYVDVYFKGIKDNRILFGKLAQNLKVLAVKDSAGNHVFENTSEERTPNQIIFAVPEEMHELLRTAEYISGAEIILVPTNVSYTVDVNDDTNKILTEITSDQIKTYIEEYRSN